MRRKDNGRMPYSGITPKDIFLGLTAVAADHAPLSNYLLYPVPIHCDVPVVALLLLAVGIWMLTCRR